MDERPIIGLFLNSSLRLEKWIPQKNAELKNHNQGRLFFKVLTGFITIHILLSTLFGGGGGEGKWGLGTCAGIL
jgi:hypothetical protein